MTFALSLQSLGTLIDYGDYELKAQALCSYPFHLVTSTPLPTTLKILILKVAANPNSSLTSAHQQLSALEKYFPWEEFDAHVNGLNHVRYVGFQAPPSVGGVGFSVEEKLPLLAARSAVGFGL